MAALSPNGSPPPPTSDTPMVFSAEPPDPLPKFIPPPRPTFKDAILKDPKPILPFLKSAPVTDEFNTVGLVDGNASLPSLDFSESVQASMYAPWRDTLVVSVMGRRVNFPSLRAHLIRLWKPAGSFEMMEAEDGKFLVKMDQDRDRNRALFDGPWMIYDHYIAVSPWTEDFLNHNHETTRTAVWVRFPGLSLVYYEESILQRIAWMVGRPIKVDPFTKGFDRGKFARVCIEVDLSKPLIGKLRLDGRWQRVAYEGLHLLCASCGRYGHLEGRCEHSPVGEAVDPSSVSGTPVNKGKDDDSSILMESPIIKDTSLTGMRDREKVNYDKHASGSVITAGNMGSLDCASDSSQCLLDNTDNQGKSLITHGNSCCREPPHGDWIRVSKPTRRPFKASSRPTELLTAAGVANGRRPQFSYGIGKAQAMGASGSRENPTFIPSANDHRGNGVQRSSQVKRFKRTAPDAAEGNSASQNSFRVLDGLDHDMAVEDVTGGAIGVSIPPQ